MSHNKLRTFLTGLSVAWGIFMLITLVSVANGVITGFEKDMMSSSNQQISVWGGVTSKPYKGYSEGRRITLKNRDLDAVGDQMKEDVKEVNTTIYCTANVISTPVASVSNTASGVYPSAQQEDHITLEEGRFINGADMDARAKVIVLPLEYAKTLFPSANGGYVGRRVTYNNMSFLVVGIYNDRWRRNPYIPYTTARNFIEDKEQIGQMKVMLNGVDNSDEAKNIEKRLRKTLASVHDFDPEDESATWLWNAVAQTLTIRSGMGIMNLGVWILGLLTLLSGVIGISNIMFVSVKERTHEIGIRRAIGAKPRKILTQILAESIVITTLFGYIGIVLGTGLTELLASLSPDMLSYARVDLAIAAQVTVVLIVAGALAGLFPALKALKVKPVEALRDE